MKTRDVGAADTHRTVQSPSLAALAAGLLTLAAAVSPARTAAACGGCFAPQDPPTVVSGHRMVMSVSPTQSVLWDQIQYSGEPEEFAWVLPVKPGARVEASTAAFFEALEAASAVRVVPPMLDCGSSTGGIGCGSSDTLSLGALDEDSGQAPAEPVEVVHQGTVGPYETVTLSTQTPGALNAWLDGHGYAVTPASQPVIDAYVTEGFDFIALRLLPGKGVQQMTPVRVVSPGGGLTLPLRMVAIGTGAETPIVLYVVGEGRYRADGLTEVALDRGLLSWDFRDSTTNYEQLRAFALSKDEGRSFLTAFAERGPLSRVAFFEDYAARAVANAEAAGCAPDFPASATGAVVNPCPPGEPWDSPACATAVEGIDARRLGCEDLDDLSVAMEGLHLEDVWLTRLEMILPRDALTADLTLAAASAQTPVSNLVDATIAVHAEGACPGGATPLLRAPRAGPRAWRGWLALGLVAGAVGLAIRRAGREQRGARALGARSPGLTAGGSER